MHGPLASCMHAVNISPGTCNAYAGYAQAPPRQKAMRVLTAAAGGHPAKAPSREAVPGFTTLSRQGCSGSAPRLHGRHRARGASEGAASTAENAPAASRSSGMSTRRRRARRWMTKRSCGSTSDSTDPGLQAPARPALEFHAWQQVHPCGFTSQSTSRGLHGTSHTFLRICLQSQQE